MKRLVGGDYLLDLSPIEIEESVDGETYTSITDKSVLDQLTGLKAFIGKSGMIKPVWVKLLNGETDELIVTRGSLSTSDGVTFLIKVLLAGFILTLSVEFTQAETDDHTPLDEWYIDSNDAKYILVSDTQSLAQELADFEGDVNIDGDLTVSGSINGEEDPSVKKVYCHPCTILTDITEGTYAGRKYYLTCLIFNDSETPFTLETFMTYITGLCRDYGAKIMLSGSVWTTSATIVATCMEYDTENATVVIRGLISGTANIDKVGFSTVTGSNTTFTDGVNQIN